jgi:hypothetical protein
VREARVPRKTTPPSLAKQEGCWWVKYGVGDRSVVLAREGGDRGDVVRQAGSSGGEMMMDPKSTRT